jgi:hypothetical protein
LRRLIALEIDRLIDDLERRRDFLIEVWGHHRARAPFVETTFSRWKSLSFSDLILLDEAEITFVSAFYRELDDLRLYLEHTQDMPRALAKRFDGSLARLKQLGDEALGSLGGAPAPPIIDLGEHVNWFGGAVQTEE